MTEPARQDTLPPSVGQILREARETQGISLETVAKHLCISKRQLVSLEEDSDALTCDVYTLGFLRSYAQFLDLNAVALVQKFRDQTTAPPPPLLVFPSPLPEGGKPTWRIICLALLVLACVVAAYKWWGGHGPAPLQQEEPLLVPQPLKEPTKPEVAPQDTTPPVSQPVHGAAEGLKETEAEPQDTTPPVSQPTPVAAAEGLKEAEVVPQETTPPVSQSVPLVAAESLAPAPSPQSVLLKATEETWVEVNNDKGEVVVSRLFHPGQAYEFKAPQKLILKTGNARGVRLTFGDKILVFPGPQGEVKGGISLDPAKWAGN